MAYHEKVQNVNELFDTIVTTAECITNEMLASTWWGTEYCLDVCHATNSAHTETYWEHK
jgi:hypothetical protein